MTPQQMEVAARKIRRHYKLSRKVTDVEVLAEVANLKRKAGDYDDLDGPLAASLETGDCPIEL